MSFPRLFLLLGPLLAAAAVSKNNLDSLIGNEKLKFVFVGGKGGVGKTTSSSAIAAQLSLSLSQASNSNKRVLLISTDPAHSLSDAFRMPFSNVPTAIMPDLPNLEVMEVNPADTMNKELSSWSELAKELGYDPSAKDEEGEGGSSIGEKINSFQEWLSGIPGIDEATALSSAIEHIESGRYDMIVFDTAPTGHTLKLLELPKVLQLGLDKLEGWQATLWGYWEMVRGFTSGSADSAGVKEKVSKKLKEYKASISRVSNMITDAERTRFVVVCIAEYLSISESTRLLSELERFNVVASHIVVNQLVTDYLEDSELEKLEKYAEDAAPEEGRILEKALAASRLTSARRNIQNKYLKELKKSEQVTSKNLHVLEVPLLPSEVTGPKAILGFSHYLIGKEMESKNKRSVGVEGERSKKARAAEAESSEAASRDEENAAQASVTAPKKEKKKKGADMKAAADGIMGEIMKDPELAKMIEDSPKLKGIAEEVKKNPMSGLQYMSDPEVAPFLKKAMAKLMPGMEGMFGGGGGGGGKRKGKGGNKDPMAGLGDLGALLGGMGGGPPGKGGKADPMAGLGDLLKNMGGGEL